MLKIKKIIESNAFVFAILCILVGVSYFNSVYNAFVSDDIAGVLKNPYIGSLRVVFAQATFLHYFILYVIYKLFGLQPFAYRMSDILFHLGASFLLYLLLKAKLKKEWAFIAASVFAVHPLLVESVTWISGGIYVQYSFFILFGLYLYSKSARDVRYYVPSLLAFLAACFISEKAVVFPLIVAVYELCFGSLKKRLTQFLPFAAVGAVWTVWYVLKLQNRIQLQNQQYYQKGVFENPFTRAVTALSSYLQLAVLPDKLTLYHSEITYGRTEFFMRAVLVVLFFLAFLWSFRKNKAIFFWLSLFIISLLPTLLPFKIAWAVAERYVYLGTAGLIASVIIFLGTYFKKQRIHIFFAALCAVVFLSGRTIVRNLDWKNEDTLWQATAAVSPSDYKSHNNLGVIYQKHKQYREALQEFQRAIELNPRFRDGYYNMAITYHATGKLSLALRSYRKTIELDPQYWQAYNGAAAILVNTGKYDEAISLLQKGSTLNKNFAPWYHNLGKAYEMKNDLKKAIEYYQLAVQYDQNLWQSYTNLANIYYNHGEYKLAEENILHAIEINPSYEPLKESLKNIREKEER